ncbi:hypothetical protein LTR84_008953 [Exophiala bonariae]|uniref:Glucose-methanol-choline oxidoreductase N-terminal domain-containing protein n=1 Tax=Exophiala bonariae TaxID=1690606 RepID=A0AAV9MW47_9EURO|nr:hypothetical protein LTR84_008953 [Exophiala bonariae]
MAQDQLYDFIIVGGGVAGLAFASRLSQLNNCRILVIEAGVDPSDTECIKTVAGYPLAAESEHACTIAVEPNKNLNGRGRTPYVGKALGGSGAVNGGAWTRGPKVDYDTWAEMVGDHSWSYEQLLPYFRKVEKVNPGVDGMRDELQHGYDGFLTATPVKSLHPARQYPLRDKVKQAWDEAGIPYVADGNNGEQNGLTELVEVWVKGRRQLPSKILDLAKVKVRTMTSIARVLIEEGQAIGVETVKGERLLAAREVIVSAGVYHTPKLLMLSGIGEPQELTKLGIEVVSASPEVGRNLKDHLAVGLTWKLKHPETGLAAGSPHFTDPSFFWGWPLDFIQFGNLNQDGPLKVLASNDKDTEFLLRRNATHFETVFLYAPMGKRFTGVTAEVDGSYATSISVCLATTSRGSITLRSADPTEPPVVDVNFNATESDKFILREALRKNASVWLNTESGKSFVSHEMVPEGYTPITAETSDAEIDKRIEDLGYSLDHPMGSCSMGKVVDSHCRVKGVDRLRVVDASVFPLPLACHIQNAVYVLAEKIADWIAQGE